MKTLFLTTILTLTFTSASKAMVIEDPRKIMQEVEFFKEGRSFKKEFRVGDRVSTVSNSCWAETDENGDTVSGCDAKFGINKVTKVTKTAAFINKNFAISKDTYENELERNPLKLLTQMNEFQSFVTKQNLDQSESVMRLDSYEEVFSSELGVETMKIKFTMIFTDSDYTIEFPMYIVLAQGVPFAGQIAEFSFDPELSDLPSEWDVMFKVIDWVKFL